MVPQVRVRSLHDNLGEGTLAEVRLWPSVSGWRSNRVQPKLTCGACSTHVSVQERREHGAPGDGGEKISLQDLVAGKTVWPRVYLLPPFKRRRMGQPLSGLVKRDQRLAHPPALCAMPTTTRCPRFARVLCAITWEKEIRSYPY